MFLSQQVKRKVLITNKNGTHELTHELPNNVRLQVISGIVGIGTRPPFTFHSYVFCPSPLFNQNYPLALVKVLHILVVQIQCTVSMTQTCIPK